MWNFSALPASSLRGRLARLPLRLIPPATRVRVLQGPLRGARWVVGASVHGCWLGSYEMEKQVLFARHAEHATVVYDIGANVGFYTLLASRLIGRGGRVVAFEPSDENLVFLRRHLSLNGSMNVAVCDLAVADTCGEASFVRGPTRCMGHLVRESGIGEIVRTTTIDYLVGSGAVPAPGLVKIDVEGAEALVLAGMETTVSQSAPTIFLATHGHTVHAECCAKLCSWGYSLTPLDNVSLENASEVLAVHSARSAA